MESTYIYTCRLIHTYVHIQVHSEPYTHLCTFIVAYFCAPPKQFLSFCQRAAFAAFYVAFSLYTHTDRSARCVCAVLCTVPICLGHSHKKQRSFSCFKREAGQPGDVATAAAQCWFYFIPYPQCGDYFVYNAFLIGLGHKLYSNWLCNQREIS